MITKFLMFMFMIELIWIGKVIELPTSFFFVAGMQAVLAFVALFEGGRNGKRIIIQLVYAPLNIDRS